MKNLAVISSSISSGILSAEFLEFLFAPNPRVPPRNGEVRLTTTEPDGTCVSSIIRNSILIDCLRLIQSLCPPRLQQLAHCQLRPYPNNQVHRSAKPRLGNNMYLCILITLHLRLQRFPGRYLHPTVSKMGEIH